VTLHAHVVIGVETVSRLAVRLHSMKNRRGVKGGLMLFMSCHDHWVGHCSLLVAYIVGLLANMCERLCPGCNET
jgi:hypothetical protein